MAGCSAQQTAQNIAAAFIAGHNAVAYHKSNGTDMVRDQTQGYILLMVRIVGRACQAAYLIQQRTDGIYIENGIHVLNNNSQTLQTHTGINILMGQFNIVTLAISIKLRKYVVPDLHVTIAVAAYGTSGLAAAISFSAVIVDLRAGTAGACSVLPEVVFLAEAKDTLRRDALLLVPDLESFIVILVDGRVQTVGIQANHLGEEFPRPCDGFLLKVVAEGEVTQHLEECAVTGSLAYVLDITGTDALLASCHACAGWNLLTGKIRLQGSHAGGDQQYTVIIVRNQGVAALAQMSLALKKVQKHFA